MLQNRREMDKSRQISRKETHPRPGLEPGTDKLNFPGCLTNINWFSPLTPPASDEREGLDPRGWFGLTTLSLGLRFWLGALGGGGTFVRSAPH